MEKVLFSIKELTAMGYPAQTIKYDVHAKGQTFATMTAGRGKWLINKAKYDKWLERRK